MILKYFIFIYSLILPICLLANDEFLKPSVSTHELMAQLLKNRHNKINTIPICYNYSCLKQDSVQISKNDIQQIYFLFKDNINQHSERLAIANSIAFFERLAAQQSPVYNDKGKNYQDNNLPGSMDCIDESFNTTQYLHFIDNLNILKWHSVEYPVYRSPWLMGQHWSARIKVLSTRQFYAVDSWEKDNGNTPIVQLVEQWKVRDVEE